MTDGYMFEQFTDEWKRLINQTGLKTRMPDREGNEQFNCAWDAAAAPDGRLYFPMSSECGWCGTEKLVYYDYESNEVIDCLRTLPEKYRAPMLLHYCQGYSVRETAAILHRREGTVKSQLSRGRELLKGELDFEQH